ncbi:MAG: ferritin-like domain-containing protein [Ferruginibacter sp.]
MSTLINLSDLLKHEIDDLYSAEEQIIEALPDVIGTANNPALKKALDDHLKVTRTQLKRLDKVRDLMGNGAEQSEEQKGFFIRLFGEGKHKCKGTQGLIDEANKLMNEELTPQVMDAAIIAAVQKIEHYEISGYGTAKAFAIEMNMDKVANLLNETLNEEYAADDSLTSLAVSRLNTKADQATVASLGDTDDMSNGNSKNAVRNRAAKKAASKKAAPKKATASKATAKKAATKSPAKKAPSKKAAPKKVAGKKAPVKKSAPKKTPAKNAAPKKSAGSGRRR